MNLIDAFVKSPVKVAVGVLLVALFGVVALRGMPLQLTPEVQTPTITIETRWPGASPQEVEREIVLEQEEYLKSVEGITKLSSESTDSAGKITMEFLVGTEMDEVLLKVNSKLQQVREYPEDADQPVISTANANDRPIAWFMLSPRPPSAEQYATFKAKYPHLKEEIAPVEKAHNVGLGLFRLRDLAKRHPEARELLPDESVDVTTMRRFAEDEIEAVFERVPGVSQSNVIGGLLDELQVIVDPERLAARDLTILEVRNALRGQNQDTSAGDFWEGKRRWVVRTLGQFRNTEQVENQLLAVRDGAPVYVKDVAEVRLGYKKPDGIMRRFGESSVGLNALRETGANVIDVMSGLREATAQLNETVLKRRNLQLTQVYDETEYIYSAVDLVQDNIYVGGALTMIVLMSFLHLGVRTLIAAPLILGTAVAAAFGNPWFFAATLAIVIATGFWFARGSLVVGLAIPISIVGTFLVLGMMGRTLNVISLAGLAFAVGMLVDNAVVVLENIYRRYDDFGEPPFTAAVRGASEVWGAIIASTLTTVAVFVPVVFIQEEAGQLFRDIAIAITAAVSLSAIVAITVIPTASARLLTKNRESKRRRGRVGRTLDRIGAAIIWPVEALGAGLVKLIVGVNGWIQRGVLRQIAVIASLLAVTFWATWQFWPKVEYLPTGNRN
ncbi:MAG: efflux RND transporter permease subunit, partial [Planctomycetota bacterium]|nr:efflux RND transporter permease subunit [Planctomycetota bacterium]